VRLSGRGQGRIRNVENTCWVTYLGSGSIKNVLRKVMSEILFLFLILSCSLTPLSINNIHGLPSSPSHSCQDTRGIEPLRRTWYMRLRADACQHLQQKKTDTRSLHGIITDILWGESNPLLATEFSLHMQAILLCCCCQHLYLQLVLSSPWIITIQTKHKQFL
jgi:hypothetical protein